MYLEEAVEKSKVAAAYRPYYYSGYVDPEVDKVIVCVEMLDYHVAKAKDFSFFSEFDPAQSGKIIGKDDWQPVAPKE